MQTDGTTGKIWHVHVYMHFSVALTIIMFICKAVSKWYGYDCKLRTPLLQPLGSGCSLPYTCVLFAATATTDTAYYKLYSTNNHKGNWLEYLKTFWGEQRKFDWSGIWTCDHLNTVQVLYQLSYPALCWWCPWDIPGNSTWQGSMASDCPSNKDSWPTGTPPA